MPSDSRIDDSERAFVVNEFYTTLNIAVTRIEVRFQGVRMVAEKFNFLFPGNLVKLDTAQNKEATLNFVRGYDDGFEIDDLEREVRSFQIEFLDKLNAEDVKKTLTLCQALCKSSTRLGLPHPFLSFANCCYYS